MKRTMLLLVLLAGGCRATQAVDDSDPAVKARIEIQLQGRPDIELRYVTIDVTLGVATISGLVPSFRQRMAIQRLVAKTPGVESVLNNLAIQD